MNDLKGKRYIAVRIIRPFRVSDALTVGQLIADTYTNFNLWMIPEKYIPKYLGPFVYAYSDEEEHKDAIALTLQADITLVAEVDNIIAGILRGRSDKLQSLFVRKNYQRQGIGTQLISEFERYCRQEGAAFIKVQATLYAVPFYLASGYKKTTGIRKMRSFDGPGLPYQPMKKIL